MALSKEELRRRTCCFTGHRNLPPEKLGEISQRLEQTLRMLISRGVCYFGAGGARGFDTLAAQTVIRLRGEFPHIKLILVLPCLSQTSGWRAEDVTAYNAVLAAADKVKYTSMQYSAGCMHKRNRHLADNSSFCVCYLSQGRGGTACTVGHARSRGLEVLNLAEA